MTAQKIILKESLYCSRAPLCKRVSEISIHIHNFVFSLCSKDRQQKKRPSRQFPTQECRANILVF